MPVAQLLMLWLIGTISFFCVVSCTPWPVLESCTKAVSISSIARKSNMALLF